MLGLCGGAGGSRWRDAALMLAVLVVLGLDSGRASAGEPSVQDRAMARKLAGEAIDLVKAGDCASASRKFDEADRLVPAPTLKIEAARCLAKIDRLLEAADRYRATIATELKPWAPRVHHDARKAAVPELAQLLEQVPSIEVTVEGATGREVVVLVDGTRVDDASLGESRQVNPGTYTFEARSGIRLVSRQINLRRGEHAKVLLRLPPPSPDEPAGPAPPGAPPPAPGGPWRAVGWSAVAIGGAGLSVWSIAGLVAMGQEQDLLDRCAERKCPPEAHDDARAYATTKAVSTAGFVVGLVGLAAGTGILLFAPSGAPAAGPAEEERHTPPAEVEAYVGVGAGGIRVRF
ncbi:MAG: hypothetical protein HY744_09480 [Deltaproteobacteria bacterium]|nr:hypothetical protein [Deltaproteobacteria bacterium]